MTTCRSLITASVLSLALAGLGCGSSAGGAGNDGGPSGSGGKSGTSGTGGTSGGSGGTSGSGGASGAKIVGNGCAGGTCLNPTCQAMGTPAPIGTSPELGFEMAPSYIPTDVIIPTFDDVPDGASDMTDPTFKVYGAGEYTKQILSFLKTNNMHMDFFINRDNWCGEVKDDQDCIATLT